MQLEMELDFSEKFCTHCQSWLSVDMFGLNSRTPDKLHHWCKPCINAGNRDYKNTPEGRLAAKLARDRYNRRQKGEQIFHINPPRRRERGTAPKVPELRKIMKEQYVSFLRVIKHHVGCQVCGEHDPVCLDFHHKDPSTKEFNLASSNQSKMATSRLVAEIMKCHVLCSNCHRKVHSGSLVIENLPLLSLQSIVTAVNIDDHEKTV